MEYASHCDCFLNIFPWHPWLLHKGCWRELPSLFPSASIQRLVLCEVLLSKPSGVIQKAPPDVLCSEESI